MAEAFKKGNLGVLDYYKLDNIASDTSMRQSIAGVTDDSKEESEAVSYTHLTLPTILRV